LGDIRYGGNTLAEHAFVPVDLEVGVIVCPYTGGRLSLNSFKLVEYVKQGSTDWLDVIAIVNEPQLTAVEKAANRLIPEDQRFGAVGKHLGSGSNALLWVAVGLLVVYEAAQVYEWLAQDNDDDDNVGGAGDDQAADDAGDMDEGHAGDAQAEAGDADDADDQGDADAGVDADADDDADAGDDGDGDDDDDGEISRGDFEAVFEATLYGQLVSRQDFERLGPAASVRQLLTIRRDVLTGKKVIGAKKT
jgi:hypothetical protein